MLLALHIHHYAIVKHLALDFSQGMTVFTGETGAGKSIMIDALMLALGGRGDLHVVRPGAEKCDISAIFQIAPDSPPWQFLEEHDALNDQEVILRRVITAEGRSRAYINGHLFPLQKVKALSTLLVHIHGQHEHQTLLSPATHRMQLDRFGDHAALLDTVSRAFHHCQILHQAIEACTSGDVYTRDMALLSFQIQELEALTLQSDEMDALTREHYDLQHAKDYLEHAQNVAMLLEGREDSQGIISALYQTHDRVLLLPQQQVGVHNAAQLMQQAIIYCEEALGEVQAFGEHIHLDEARLLAVEARMSTLHQMARKYQVSPNQLLETLETMRSRLYTMQAQQDEKATLEKAYHAAQAEYGVVADALRAARAKTAPVLAEKITAIIQKIGMPKGQIVMQLTARDHMSAHGLDKVEYWVCTNPGMPFEPLGKVASGGELSRLSLAIQMVTAERAVTPSLFFDEVDVGIGGVTAAQVGRMLRELGTRLQVFCVTHQAQVAAQADHHFVVEKHMVAEETYSEIHSLVSTVRIEEIARMLGGLAVTDTTRHHAQALIQEAQIDAL